MSILCIQEFKTQSNTSLNTYIYTYVIAECQFSNLVLSYFKHILKLLYRYTKQEFQITSLRLHYATEQTSTIHEPR